MTIININHKILEESRLNEFGGYDPFDSLNSKIFSAIPGLKKGLIGLAWIQFNKRSIFNFRKLLAVPKKRNPKGIGLFILGLLEDYKRSGNADYLNQAIELGDWLLTQQSEPLKWSHACWGYHFDWNARAFFVPQGKPNIITTVYVAKALYTLYETTSEERFLKPALGAADFIVNTLYSENDGRKFFAYIPAETAFVHNASLWGAAWVGFVANITNNDSYKQLALDVARQSINEQAEDGSWVYGARHHHQFIDGFHTGYNLEALYELKKALATSEFDESISKGLIYYKENLFETDGTAKYYYNNRYPLDMHSVSQAIFTLIKVGGTEADIDIVEKIINRSIETLYMPNRKRFVYQKHKYFTNRINYIRWTQAWVYYSFSFYNHYKSQQPQ